MSVSVARYDYPVGQAAIATSPKIEARIASPSATRSDCVVPFMVCSLFKDHFYQRSACLLTTHKPVETCYPHMLVFPSCHSNCTFRWNLLRDSPPLFSRIILAVQRLPQAFVWRASVYHIVQVIDCGTIRTFHRKPSQSLYYGGRLP